MDYTTLSLAEVRSGLDAMARDTLATFGGFDARQLNWRPMRHGGASRSASSTC